MIYALQTKSRLRRAALALLLGYALLSAQLTSFDHVQIVHDVDIQCSVLHGLAHSPAINTHCIQHLFDVKPLLFAAPSLLTYQQSFTRSYYSRAPPSV